MVPRDAAPSSRRAAPARERNRSRLSSQYHMAPKVVGDSRRLLHAIACKIRTLGDTPAGDTLPWPLVVDDWPDRAPDIEESVAEFVPTAVLLIPVPHGSRAVLGENGDHSDPQRFVTSIHVIEGRRDRTRGHVLRVAAWSYPAPPAEPWENLRRGQAMAELRKGAPLARQDGWSPGLLTGRLPPDAWRMTRLLSLDEQIALVTLLTARQGWAAFVSPEGDWPTSPVLSHLAGRLRCRVVRISFVGIPPVVRRRLRHARYEM